MLVLGLTWAQAAETGSFSYRAHKMYNDGRYPESIRLLQKALEASAKEADLEGENRVIMDMAQIMGHLYKYEKANKLFETIRPSSLNPVATLSLLRMQLELLNQQGKYAESWALFDSKQGLLNDDSPEMLHGSILLAAAVANAGTGADVSRSGKMVEKATDLLDDEAPGMLSLAQARIADLQGDLAQATKLYETTLKNAQKSRKIWIAGQVLIRLGQLAQKGTDSLLASEYYLRAAKLYMGMGIDRPFLQAAEAYLALQPQDEDLARAVHNSKLRLNPAEAIADTTGNAP
jgi:tetratricopeptide (TPR) repeat protein